MYCIGYFPSLCNCQSMARKNLPMQVFVKEYVLLHCFKNKCRILHLKLHEETTESCTLFNSIIEYFICYTIILSSSENDSGSAICRKYFGITRHPHYMCYKYSTPFIIQLYFWDYLNGIPGQYKMAYAHA